MVLRFPFVLLLLFYFVNNNCQRIRHGFNVRVWEERDDGRVWNSDTTSNLEQHEHRQCDRLESSELMKRMRDAGIYDSTFMAPDIQTAAKVFPDLADKKFTLKPENYVCDKECETETGKVRKVMQTNRNFRRPTVTYYYTRPRYMHTTRLDAPTGHSLNPQVNVNFWSIRPTSGHYYRRRPKRQQSSGRRQRKLIDDNNAAALILKHSGRTQGVIGTTIAIECNGEGKQNGDKTSVPSNLEQMCRQCVAVRQLPQEYFPRVLNEVICATESCIKGHGQCIQRFLPFKVLKNFGTIDCQNWQQVTIHLRTCCDCMVDKSSPIHGYIYK